VDKSPEPEKNAVDKTPEPEKNAVDKTPEPEKNPMDLTKAFTTAGEMLKSGIAGFDAAVPAPDFTPLPGGIYHARVLRGESCSTKAGDDAYRMRFEVVQGEHSGKTVVRIWTFSKAAMAYTKRDLALFGLTTVAQLLSPFPAAGKEVHVQLRIAVQRGDDGVERNDIKRIDQVSGKDSPAADYLLDDEPKA
jgi:hypothetical protein